MKKLFLFIVFTTVVTLVYPQRSIDALFDKYAGTDGFVTVTISGNLLKFAACLDNEKDDDILPANIKEIRILAQDDDKMNVDNFYDRVIKDINLEDYEEFMRVKESGQNLRMLVRAEGNRFREFLLIAGGEDNAIIQIKGDMTFKEAKKFSAEVQKKHGVRVLADSK